MRLLLVNCLNLHEGLRYSENASEQLGLLYVASSLRKYFSNRELEIKIIYGNFTAMLHEFKPDIVGLSAVSQNYHIAQKYASIAKRTMKLTIIIGGVHISTLPHTLTRDMDVGVIHEGEETIVELMKIFMAKKELPINELAGIKGIVFYNGENIKVTNPRPQIEDLDSLPMPARDMYYHPVRGIFTSRGCPYNCIFCFSKAFWGRSPRYFSPEYVIKEMEDLVRKYNATQITIYDDLFTSNISRFKKIVENIISLGIHRKVVFKLNLRPNEVTEEIAVLLKSINVTRAFLGIESGNERILKYLKGQACSVEQNYNAVKILKKHKIITYGGIILGSPDETKEEIEDTFRFVRKSGIDAFVPLMLVPYPGTPIWEIAKKRKLVSLNMDWNILREEFNEVSKRSIIMSETLSREELWNYYNKFKAKQKLKLVIFILKHPLMGVHEIKKYIARQYYYGRLVFAKTKHG